MKEHTGSGGPHPINCDCYTCTNGDSYITRIKRRVGKNAGRSRRNGMPARHAVYGSLNHADEETKFKLGSFLAERGLGALGELMQKKKSGMVLPKALDKIAGLGLKAVDAAADAGVSVVEKETGKKVLKFAPWIVGGVLVLVISYFIFKK